jgi:hypothetical protein
MGLGLTLEIAALCLLLAHLPHRHHSS